MAWLQYTLTCKKEEALQLETCFDAAGAVAVIIEANDPKLMVFETPFVSTELWADQKVIVLFEDQDLSTLQQRLKLFLPTSHYQALKFERVEDKNWLIAWQENFKVQNINNKLWVCPSWLSSPVESAQTLILDPGMAFGTGTHATTHLCLTWLSEQVLPGLNLIDYGCGSGILGLSALKLGAAHVWALDCDSQALQVTGTNGQLNNIDPSQLSLCLPGGLPDGFSADILVANILFEPLKALGYLFSQLVKPQGKLVLSGVLRHQSDDLISYYTPWFTDFKLSYEEEWVCLTSVRQIDRGHPQ